MRKNIFLFLLTAFTFGQTSPTNGKTFFGNSTQTTNNVICQLMYPDQRGFMILTFKNSQENPQMLSQYITSLEVKVYNKSFDDPNYIIININLSAKDYSYEQWTMPNATYRITRVIEGKIFNQSHSAGPIYVTLYGSVVRKAYVRVQIAKDYSCSIVYKSDTLQYKHPMSTLIWFLIMEFIVTMTQLFSCIVLIQGSEHQTVSLKRISLISFICIFVLTSSRALRLLVYTLDSDQDYFTAILIATIFTLSTMFNICKQIAIFEQFNPSENKIPLATIIITILLPYIYISYYGSGTLFVNLIIPVTCYTFQSRKNFELRHLYSKVYYSYYIGILGTQILEPLYLYAMPNNVFFVEASTFKSIVWISVFTIGSVIMGYQFKYYFLPESDEYIRRQTTMIVPSIFRISKIEQSQSLPLSQVLEDNMYIPECSICLTQITEEVEKDLRDILVDNPIIDQLLNKENGKEDYPVKTNCNHFFHKICIMNWIKNNKSCPICRNQKVKYNKLRL